MADWETSLVAHVQTSVTMDTFRRLELIAKKRTIPIAALVREILLEFLAGRNDWRER